jgi:hypothetical protein
MDVACFKVLFQHFYRKPRETSVRILEIRDMKSTRTECEADMSVSQSVSQSVITLCEMVCRGSNGRLL